MSVDSHVRSRPGRMPVALSLIAGLFGFSAAAQGVDERDIVQSPTTFPWNTVVKVKIGPEGGGRGSGGLIAGCTILTNGHVVWNGQTDTWREIYSVHPGSYYSESLGRSVDPYGSKVDSGLATNTRWTDTLDSKYDYGAIFVTRPFSEMGITTYMPVAFEENPDFINMSGYPSENLPLLGTGVAQEQWRAFGDVGVYEARLMYYEATSTGGASGSPVWVFHSATGERYVVGVNRGHNGTWDGIGVRMVNENRDLIESWMNRACASGSNLAASEPQPKLPLRSLLQERRTLRGESIPLLPANHFRVASPARSPAGLVPKREVLQIIEGEYYRWQEFHGPGGRASGDVEGSPMGRGGLPTRFIRLLAPESRWLSAEEAAVVLSASLLWTRPAPPVNPVIDETGARSVTPVRPPEPRRVLDEPSRPELEVQSTR